MNTKKQKLHEATTKIKDERNARKVAIKKEEKEKIEKILEECEKLPINQRRNNKDYIKALRWARRNKVKTTEGPILVEEKTYNLLGSYDKHLADQVKTCIKENKLKANFVTDIYFYVKDVDKATVEKFKELFASVTCTIKNKTYKVHLQPTVASTKVVEKKKSKAPTNNTGEDKTMAKAKRTVKNLCKSMAIHRSAVIRNLRKKKMFDVADALIKKNIKLKDAESYLKTGKKTSILNITDDPSKMKRHKTTKIIARHKPSKANKKPIIALKKGQNEANSGSNIKQAA